MKLRNQIQTKQINKVNQRRTVKQLVKLEVDQVKHLKDQLTLPSVGYR